MEWRFVMRIDATRWEGPALLGLALAKAGHYEEALTSLNQAINLARPEKQTALRQFISDVSVEKQRDVSRTADTQFRTGDFRLAASSYYNLWRSHLNEYDPRLQREHGLEDGRRSREGAVGTG